MSTVEDFKNAPVGATATCADGGRAMKLGDDAGSWLTPTESYLDEDGMVYWGYTLDAPAPESAREALDLAWGLAHPVKPGQVIPKGTRYLAFTSPGLREYTACVDREIRPELAPTTRTLEPLPEPEWLDAPAVLAETSTCPDRKVWTPESGGVWKCSCCRDEIHWYELVDVTPLYPKETEA